MSSRTARHSSPYDTIAIGNATANTGPTTSNGSRPVSERDAGGDHLEAGGAEAGDHLAGVDPVQRVVDAERRGVAEAVLSQPAISLT